MLYSAWVLSLLVLRLCALNVWFVHGQIPDNLKSRDAEIQQFYTAHKADFVIDSSDWESVIPQNIQNSIQSIVQNFLQNLSNDLTGRDVLSMDEVKWNSLIVEFFAIVVHNRIQLRDDWKKLSEQKYGILPATPVPPEKPMLALKVRADIMKLDAVLFHEVLIAPIIGKRVPFELKLVTVDMNDGVCLVHVMFDDHNIARKIYTLTQYAHFHRTPIIRSLIVATGWVDQSNRRLSRSNVKFSINVYSPGVEQFNFTIEKVVRRHSILFLVAFIVAVVCGFPVGFVIANKWVSRIKFRKNVPTGMVLSPDNDLTPCTLMKTTEEKVRIVPNSEIYPEAKQRVAEGCVLEGIDACSSTTARHRDTQKQGKGALRKVSFLETNSTKLRRESDTLVDPDSSLDSLSECGSDEISYDQLVVMNSAGSYALEKEVIEKLVLKKTQP